MAQFARPDADVSNNGNGGFADIDEATASDADYWWGDDNAADVLEVSLGNVTDPGVSTGHIVRVRLAKVDGGVYPGTGGTTPTQTVELFQGTTLIATAVSAVNAPDAWTQTDYTLSAAEADAITDYTDLRVRVTNTASGGSPANRRGGAASWAELEVPDAAAVTEKQGTDSGSGAEAAGEQATYARTESGSGAEAATASAAYAGSDLGAGIEAAAETGAYTVTDAGAGVEAGQSVFPLTAADAAEGAETAVVTAAYSRPESGAGVELSTVTGAFIRADEAAAAEIAALVADYTLTDGAAGTDSSILTQLTEVQAADVGAGSDAAAMATGQVRLDAASGTDAAVSQAAFGAADAASGTELAQLVAALVAGTELGGGADLAQLALAFLVADAAAGTDAGTQAASAGVIPAPDYGSPITTADLGRGGLRAPSSWDWLAGIRSADGEDE
jgi:hypothetical protein